MELERIASDVVDAAVRLHIRIGPGLFESVYEALLGKELGRRGHVVEREKLVAADLDGVHFDRGFRVDLLVNGCVAVEVKCVETLAGRHFMQLRTYVRLLDLRLGLLLNFGGARLVAKRIVNRYDGLALVGLRREERSAPP